MPAISVSRSTALVIVCGLLALLVLVGNRLAGAGTAQEPEVVAPLEPVAAAAPQRVVVHVVGAVRRPGLYRLQEGARVADAVARAGGGSRRAHLGGLNLAAPLVDGAQVLVPARLPAAPAGSLAGSTGATSSPAGEAAFQPKLSLSTATAEQLDELPGVGPVTAQKILDYRTEQGFVRSIDDLDAVPGIGPARIEQLRDLVTP
ncbi:MAG: ComEA family DNA-binding protein [Actinobacteria bacterium]|nr:ComEA family DNA-binding protein [Actinomycetota bacterium]